MRGAACSGGAQGLSRVSASPLSYSCQTLRHGSRASASRAAPMFGGSNRRLSTVRCGWRYRRGWRGNPKPHGDRSQHTPLKASTRTSPSRHLTTLVRLPPAWRRWLVFPSPSHPSPNRPALPLLRLGHGAPSAHHLADGDDGAYHSRRAGRERRSAIPTPGTLLVSDEVVLTVAYPHHRAERPEHRARRPQCRSEDAQNWVIFGALLAAILVIAFGLPAVFDLGTKSSATPSRKRCKSSCTNKIRPQSTEL